MRVLCLFLAAVSLVAQTPPDGMALVPAGEFTMGAGGASTDESPPHRVFVSAFYIDVHEVTNAEFAGFVRRNGAFDRLDGPWFRYSAEGASDTVSHYEERYGVSLDGFNPDAGSEADRRSRYADMTRWRSATAALREFQAEPEDLEALIREQARLPVRGVTWRDAVAFAESCGKRLPTEAEWEKAARGTDRRSYPWGNQWDSRLCRVGLGGDGSPAVAGSFPDGVSPYGCLDMAGNVWEWVADWYSETYYSETGGGVSDPQGPEGLPDGRLPAPSMDLDFLRTTRQGRESDTRKVIRGGGFGGSSQLGRFNARTGRRLWSNPSYWHPDVGLRCARDAR